MTQVMDHAGRPVRLGRIKPLSRPRTLRLGNYLDLAEFAPPARVDYAPRAAAAIARMYLNDTYGDCVIAAQGHMLGLWTGNAAGAPVLATDKEISNIYFAFSPRDQGCVITQVLDFAVSTGLKLGGSVHKLATYVAIDWTNPKLARVAIDLFGTLCLGIDLPGAWTNAKVWDVTRSRSVGGHCVVAVGYDEDHVHISSWGEVYRMTWAAFTSKSYLDEAYAPVSPDWIGPLGASPPGLRLDDLIADSAKLGAGTIPPIVPDSPLIDWGDAA